MIAPTLTTERLVLRALKPDDFPRFADFFASDRAKFVGGPATAEQSWRMLACEIGHWTLRGYGRFAVDLRESSEFIGLIGPWAPEGWPEPELGWDLWGGYEGRGYATEAAGAARDYAYTTLGWTTAISLVAPQNIASAKVAERLGARRDGDFTHERHGFLHVYRHPSAEEIRHAG